MAGRQVDRFGKAVSGLLVRGGIAAIVIATATALHAAVAPAHRELQGAVQVAQAVPNDPAKPAMVPPVRREPPPSGDPAAQYEPNGQRAPSLPYQPPPGYGGVIGAIQDWLARANRDYQGVVIKGLSTPAENGTANDAIAKKLEETKAEDARAIAAKRAADEARRATDAKQADERKAKLKAEQARQLNDKRAAETLAAERQASERQASEQAQADAKAEAARRAAIEETRQAAIRQAEEARRLADAQRTADARIAEERRRVDVEAAAAAAAKPADPKRGETKRTVVIVVEPIPDEQQRVDRQTDEVSDAGSSVRRLPADDGRRPTAKNEGGERLITSAISKRQDVWRTRRGSKVKSWSRRMSLGRSHRARGAACHGSGRRVTPPGRYIVRRGDSLWRIAKRHYRDGGHYRRIYRANRHSIAHPNWVYPCQRVFVPRRKR